MSLAQANPAPPDAAWPPPAPAFATACPKCKTPAQPKPSAQQCGKCQRRFVLLAGPLMDGAVQAPPPDPKSKNVKVKASGMILNTACTLGPDAVTFGTLDPVTGQFPIDTTTVPYRFIFSITVHRKVSLPAAIAWVVLGVPLMALTALVVTAAWQLALVITLPSWLLSLSVGYNVFFVKACHVRIVGLKNQLIETRYDKPWWRRKQFHSELFRRTGLVAPPVTGMI